MLAGLLLIAIQAQDGCIVYPEAPPPQSESIPLQKAGDGLWIGGIGFTAADLASAEPQTDEYSGEPVLALSFTAAGNAKFLEAQRCGVGRAIEISVDRSVLSRPVLNEPITGGKANISGGWKSRDAVQAVAARILRR